jgi:hypothetical protein
LTMRRVRFLSVFVLLALLLSVGLGVGMAQGPPPSGTSGTLDPQTQEYVLDLVRRWAYKETYDEADSEKIREEVRALSIEEAHLLCYLNSAIGDLFYPYGGPVEPVVETPRQNYLLDLARRALYERKSKSVRDEIEALSGDEQQLYTNLVTAIQEIVAGRGASYLASHLPDHQVMNVKLAEQVMEATGKNWLGMSQAELEDVLLDLVRHGKFEPDDFGPRDRENKSSILRGCPPGYAECTVASFPRNTYRTDCAGQWCVNASGFDRASNDACELIACDYRVWFYGTWGRGIDGNTVPSDCVANDAPHGLGGSSRSEVSIGWGTATGCGVFSGDYLVDHMLLNR